MVSRRPIMTTLTSFAAGHAALSGIVRPYHSGGCGFCIGFEQHRDILEIVVLAFEGEFVRRQPLHQQLKGLVIDALRLAEVETVEFGLERRHAAADAEFEPAVAHLIEHADFFDQPDRMIERQQIDQRPEPQRLRALRHR